jgi:hypothetical protein
MRPEIESHLRVLRETPERLERTLGAMDAGLVRWTPAPGKWSALEILCHMRDMEAEAYLARYRRILAEERPSLPDADGDRLAWERSYAGQEVGAALSEWRARRAEVLALLGGVREEQWSRVGVHETAGPLTMADLLRRHAVGNDEAHLRQMDSIPGRRRVLDALAATPAALARARGAAGARDVVGGMIPRERLCLERLARIAHGQAPPTLWEPSPLVPGPARARGGRFDDALAAFRGLRSETSALLRALPDPLWDRTGILPSRGAITLRALVQDLVEGDRRALEGIGQPAHPLERGRARSKGRL